MSEFFIKISKINDINFKNFFFSFSFFSGVIFKEKFLEMIKDKYTIFFKGKKFVTLNSKFQVSKSQVSNFKFQVPNSKFQVSKIKSFSKSYKNQSKFCCYQKIKNQTKKEQMKIIYLKMMEQQSTHRLKNNPKFCSFCRQISRFRGRKAP